MGGLHGQTLEGATAPLGGAVAGFAAMKPLYDSVAAMETFLVTGTRMGGLHGQTPEGATAPLGGAVAGFSKAYKRERGEALVKAVDFAPGVPGRGVAAALVAEALADPGIVEVGRHDDLRWAITLEERPAKDGRPGLELTNDSVFVVTGAAGGITSAIVADLAGASGGTFYLLDLVAEPRRDDPRIALIRQDRERLKLALIEEAKAKGERPTPVAIDRQIMAVERADAALRAVEGVEAAGGRALWRSANLMDGTGHRRHRGRGPEGPRSHRRARPRRRHRDQPQAEREGGEGVRPRLRHQGRRLLLAAAARPRACRSARRWSSAPWPVASETPARRITARPTRSCARCRARCAAGARQTRAVAIDWTAWGGIGMATRGSIPQIMAAAGISMLPPESGIPTVRRELVAGGGSGELVVAGTLGVMGAEYDETGGLDVRRPRLRSRSGSGRC